MGNSKYSVERAVALKVKSFLVFKQVINVIQSNIKPFVTLIPERLITWNSYWGLLPISILATLIFIAPSLGNRSLILTWLAIALFGHASMAPFVIYFHGKHNRKIHLLFALCMGSVRGATINLTAPVLLVEDPLQLTVRILNSAISVLYALIISAIVFSIWTNFQSDLRQILSNAIELGKSSSIKSPSNQESNFPENSQNIQQVIEDLNDFIAAAHDGRRAPLTLKEQASAIDRLINKHIRPKSAERWRQAEMIWPKVKPWKVLKESLSQTKLPINLTIIFILPLGLFGQIANSGVINGITIQLTSFVLLIAIAYLSEFFGNKMTDSIRKSNFIFLALFLFIYSPILLSLSYFIDSGSYTSNASFLQLHIASLFTFLFVAFIGSIVLTVQKDRENALDFLKSLIPDKELENMIDGGLVASTESEYAQYLHAEVQSQLMACKLLLLKAAESEFTIISPEVTQKVLDRLQILKMPYEKKPDRIPSVRLYEFQKTWQGLANMEFNLPPELLRVSRNGEIISQLIEELIVNAIRHGRAKNIVISASVSDGRCLISVLDDGRLKSTKKSGLGSTLFEVFAPDWKLVSTSQGTLATLTAKFY